MNFNKNRLTTKLWHGLKSLFNTGDALPPRFLEYAICDAFGLEHKGDSNYYADGVDSANHLQVSVKTRTINPDVLKRKTSRDFQTHPEKFLGPQVNKKHDRWTNGVEVVQRRQALPFDDVAATPEEVGRATIDGFNDVIKESYRVYNTNTTYEVVVIHGYNPEHNRYLANVYWDEYKPLNPDELTFCREKYGVSGYIDKNGRLMKVMDRVTGNSKREGTCFKEYKNLLEYTNVEYINIPLPSPWKYDEAQCLQEIEEAERNK